jgi:hypothetical protein
VRIRGRGSREMSRETTDKKERNKKRPTSPLIGDMSLS